MRGVGIVLAAGVAAAVMACVPDGMAAPHPTSDLRALATEKAAAVSILRTQAARQTALIANGHLFQAYFRAASASEGERIQRRVANVLEGLGKRYGLTRYVASWPDGKVFASTIPEIRGHENRRKASGLPAQDKIASKPSVTATRRDTQSVTWTAPVMHDAAPTLVLSVDQDLAAYERVLLHGLAGHLQVLIVDGAGKIVADSTGRAPRGQAAMFDGLTMAELRATIGAGAPEGTGVLTQDGSSRRISYQTVEDWIVVALEQPLPRPTCLASEATPCP